MLFFLVYFFRSLLHSPFSLLVFLLGLASSDCFFCSLILQSDIFFIILLKHCFFINVVLLRVHRSFLFCSITHEITENVVIKFISLFLHTFIFQLLCYFTLFSNLQLFSHLFLFEILFILLKCRFSAAFEHLI